MRIDRTHRPWAVGTAALAGVSALAFAVAALWTRAPWSGGSLIGLTFGIAAYAVMWFEALLGWRKKRPLLRIGRASTWMRGHLWLGLLTLPLILFHAGFAARGPLTLVLMILLLAAVVSGVVGAALQHYVPSRIAREVPLETIYEEIPRVRESLIKEAEAAALAVNEMEAEHSGKVRFRDAYSTVVLPYLLNPERPGSLLATAASAERSFAAMRRAAPPELHSTLATLEAISEECRQLTRQASMYRLLHGWLLVHVPVSIAVLVLGGIHAVVALSY